MNEYMIDILSAIQIIKSGNIQSSAFTSQVISKIMSVYETRADLSNFINSKSLFFVLPTTIPSRLNLFLYILVWLARALHF